MRYHRVADERDLLGHLQSPGATIVCGGTDVMVKMRAGMIDPDALVDISQLNSMRGIHKQESFLLIGAATTASEVIASPFVIQHMPFLGSVLNQLGCVQIRNRATLGGNIVNASPAADSAIPLLLVDAEVLCIGGDREQWINLDQFIIAPGRTVLAPGQFVRSLRLRIPDPGYQSFYHKVGRRNALTIAIASLGMLLWCEDGVIRKLRIAAGSVAPTPRRLRDVEAALIGRALNEATVVAASKLIADAIAPISDVRASADYRKQVMADLLVRALQQARRGS